MTTDGLVERSPVVAPVSRASGSTRGWQDRASEVATAPGAFHQSVRVGALAGIAVVPGASPATHGAGPPGVVSPGSRAWAGDPMACIAPAPDGSVASLVEAGGSAVVVVPAERRPPVADVAWARWTARTQTALHRLDAAIACRWDAVWPDAPSLVKWLEVRSAALGRELDEIRGRVELVLHLPASVGTGQDPESAASGASGASGAPGASWAADARGDFDAPASQWRRRRLRGRAHDAANRAGRAIDGPLAAFAATVRRAVPDAVGESAIVRLLVDHAAVEEVRTAAGALREAGLVERLAGPWVPGPITTHVTG